MENLASVSRVEVGFDSQYEMYWWNVIPAVWVLLAVSMVAGILGFFGRGPLNEISASEGKTTVIMSAS
jgi:hypothetical protein